MSLVKSPVRVQMYATMFTLDRDSLDYMIYALDICSTITGRKEHISIGKLTMEMYWKGHISLNVMELWPFQYIYIVRKFIGNVYFSSSVTEQCSHIITTHVG